MILIDIPNLSSLFRYISEPEAIMFFGISLVIVTIAVRWFLNKYEVTAKSKDKIEEKR